MIFSIILSTIIIIVSLLVTFFGWLAIMQFRVEPEHTTKAAARGGWVWLIAGLAGIIWGIARLF